MKTNTKAVLAPLLFLLIIGDIALNASVEYDPFAGGNRGQTGVLMYLAVQLMSQIMILYMMFLMLSHTYPFQAGLFKVVFKEFQWVFIGPTGFLLYFPLTLMLGIFRFNMTTQGKAPFLLLSNTTYLLLSIFHKLVAVGFYSQVLDASTKLWNPVYYSRTVWVQEARERGRY